MRYDYDMLKAQDPSGEHGGRRALDAERRRPASRSAAGTAATMRSAPNTTRCAGPLQSFVQGGDPSEPNAEVFPQEIVFERTIYGDSADTGLPSAAAAGQSATAKSSGISTARASSPPIFTTSRAIRCAAARQFASDYKNAPDWSQNPALEAETFASATAYDALNRADRGHRARQQRLSPDLQRSQSAGKGRRQSARRATRQLDAFRHQYRLQRQGPAHADPIWQWRADPYAYDEQTFRLTNLKTTAQRPAMGPRPQIFTDPTVVQDLRYTYDPVGNITRIADAALITVFNANQQVDPVADYTYDPLYRLIGRQRGGSISANRLSPFAPPDGNYRDYPFVGATRS